jgi:hypothetical protein
MSRRTLVVLALALMSASCGKLGSGCESRPEGTEPSVRDRFAAYRGESGPPEEGRWGTIRDQARDDEDLQTQIRQLEALGYASGTKTAPSLIGVTQHDPTRAEPGLNFYTSGHASEAVLMRMDGEVVHRWSRDFWDVWPNDRAETSQEGTQHWRRAHPFPNGDLLVIFEGLGLAKLDASSNVLWAKRNGAHHDLQVLPNGDIAVLVREARLLRRIDYRRPTLEDFVLILDADGQEKKRYSVLEAFERSKTHRHIWDESPRRWGDLFHTNSIEVLDGSSVHVHPALAEGNFLLSSRHLNTVFIVDPSVNEVVWVLRAAFEAQHDARALEGGKVMLFDNSGKGRASSVQVYDVASGALTWEYAGAETTPFYTRFCGASQRLPGANTLITESDNGRAFEVTPGGAIVWEFYNPHRAGENDELIATLFQVDRWPSDFAEWLSSE